MVGQHNWFTVLERWPAALVIEFGSGCLRARPTFVRRLTVCSVQAQDDRTRGACFGMPRA